MRKKSITKLLLLFIAVAVFIVAGWAYLSPIPDLQPDLVKLPQDTTTPTNLAWPNYGQASIGTVSGGLLQSHGEQKPVPTASVAKVVTALAVLQKHPLELSQTGPDIELGDTDVGYFENHYINGGSVVRVVSGEKISQYKALQAMLLPSANNMADSLASWAFGSQETYVNYANSMLVKMNIKNTKIADASGFSPNTVSTSDDLVLIGQKAMQNPVLAEIVAQPSATVPAAGEIKNVNWLLGEEGVVGIKTGSTDQAGGNFLFAANRKVLGEDIQVIGTILGATDRNSAIGDSKNLIKSSDGGFEKKNLLKNGQLVGVYKAPWGETTNAVIKDGCSSIVWKATGAVFKPSLNSVSVGAKSGTEVGKVTVSIGNEDLTCPVTLTKKIAGPSWTWRIFN